MNWKKTLLFISTAIGTTTLAFHVINKFIFNASDEHSEEDESNYYNWKFGNIYYKKEGTGSPVLLIHDLNHYSSSMEWDKVIGTLSKEHTVYTDAANPTSPQLHIPAICMFNCLLILFVIL